jgi:hypothetical protein
VQSAKKSRGVEVRERRSLREALFELGGMHVLVYKLATLAPMESEQVAFLQLIFSLIRGSPENAKSLSDREGCVVLSPCVCCVTVMRG